MHEFVEGLEGVEVIADDFLIAGFGNTEEEVNASLEMNERMFFEKCREWNLKLKSKLKRAQSSVAFMGPSSHIRRVKARFGQSRSHP
jgi:hypothetical protein